MKNLSILIICLSVFGFTGFSTAPKNPQQSPNIVHQNSALYQLQRPAQKTQQQKNQEAILENQRRIIREQDRMRFEQETQRDWDFINRRNR